MIPVEQHRALLEAAPTMIWRAGSDGGYDYCNERWLAFTGRLLERELGEGWTAGVHPDDLAQLMQVYRRSFERRERFEIEHRLRRYDGAYRWIANRGAPFTDAEGAFAGMIGSCADVHERHSLDESKATFLAMLAHELRTPLQALVFFSDIAREASAHEQPLPIAALDRLDRQIARLRGVAEHAARGVGVLRRPPQVVRRSIDLVALVASVVAAHQARGLRRDVRVELEVLGAARPVEADPEAMRDALAALVDNAAKFSPERGSVGVSIEFGALEVRVAVRDHGIGVPAAELERLGTPFFRASNAAPRQYPGLGLGLTLARSVALAHGGRLGFEPGDPTGLIAAVEWPPGESYVLEQRSH